MAIVSSNLRELGVVRIGTGRRALALSRVSNGKISPRCEGAIAPRYSNERTPKKKNISCQLVSGSGTGFPHSASAAMTKRSRCVAAGLGVTRYPRHFAESFLHGQRSQK